VLYQALANPAENDFAMFIKINVAQGVDAVSKGSIMRASLLKTSGFRKGPFLLGVPRRTDL
jgi:hypothetical protein